jgi:NhaP-type Na+/H+ or K+/H+ antiporter
VSLPLFTVLVLFGGWFLGRLTDKIKLPPVLGMVAAGLLLGFLFRNSAPPVLKEIEPFLKSFALIVILLRAGLGISRKALARSGVTAVLLSFVPCLFEGFSLMVVFHWLFGFYWAVSGLTGFMLAAVSPAVVVPSMLDLKAAGFGGKNDVTTAILAGASADDVFAITLFSLFLGFAGGGDVSPIKSLVMIPVSIAGGIVLGAAAGFLLVLYFHKRMARVRATEKTLILLTTALLLVQAGDWLHVAALLGVMTTGFILLEKMEPAAHELAGKLSKIWVFAQIILFVLIGFSVDPSVALGAGLKGLAALGVGLVFRSAGVLVATAFSPFNRNERLFCVISYLPKATVQAALGGVALSKGIPGGETILAIAVLAIVVTAPLGLILIRALGPRLLSVGEAAETGP